MRVQLANATGQNGPTNTTQETKAIRIDVFRLRPKPNNLHEE